MSEIRDKRKIDAYMSRLNEQTGYAAVMEKAKQEREKEAQQRDLLNKLERPDPMRVRPVPNENSREELEREDLRHKERQRVYRRVRQREYQRTR